MVLGKEVFCPQLYLSFCFNNAIECALPSKVGCILDAKSYGINAYSDDI